MVKLIDAIKNNNLKEVQLLLNNEVDTDIKNKALVEAATKGNLDIVKLLLDNGADVSTNNNLPLKRAADKLHLDVVQLLLNNGGYNKIKSVADTFLHIMKILIHNGIDSNIANKALIIAATDGYLGAVKLLLDSKASIHANHEASLIGATKNKHFDVVKLLVERRANIYIDNNIVLRIAVRNNDLDMVKLFLDHGADISSKNNMPLIIAIENNNLDMVKLLLDRGTFINTNNNALLVAIEIGNLNMIKLLLDRGANIHDNGDQPLEYAVEIDNPNIVELLLSKGAIINNTVIQNMDTYSNKIKKILSTDLNKKIIIPLTAPDNWVFKDKITQEIVDNSNCNMENEPIDPILLTPIPNNLLISVRTIDTNDKGTCFNAKNLWDYWISQTRSQKYNFRYANNPLNMQYFTVQSILYLQQFLQNVGNDKLIKNKILYNEVLNMTYFELRNELNKLNNKTVNLFPDSNEVDDEIISIYRVAVLDKLEQENLI